MYWQGWSSSDINIRVAGCNGGNKLGEKEPQCKVKKNSNCPSVFSGLRTKKKKFNEWRTTAEPAQILCNHKTGGDPITSVNCSLLRIHTQTHTQTESLTLWKIEHSHPQAPVLFCISTTCQIIKNKKIKNSWGGKKKCANSSQGQNSAARQK